ncbi:uncharacterized protein [Prorops nasuta]|uniref:uncharacterized protein n=1 Tax=Prorops nasuta TaxID=863751 RepID=UPI0034CFC9A1
MPCTFQVVTMDIFNSSYYKVQKVLLTVCGGWPFQNNSTSLILRIIFLNGIIIFVLLPEVNLKDFDAIMACLPLLSGSITGFAKATVLFSKADHVKFLLDELKRDWENFACAESEYLIIKRYGKQAKQITMFYAGGYTLAHYGRLPLFTNQVLPLNETRPRLLILPGNLYVHTDEHFFLILTLEWYGIFCVAHMVMTVDTLYITLMLHTCGMFAVLSERLENIKISEARKNNCQLIRNNTAIAEDENNYLYLIKNVKLHLRCIKFLFLIYFPRQILFGTSQSVTFYLARYAEGLNSTFNAPFITDLLFGVLIASASAVKFVMSINDPDQRIKYGMLYLTQSMRIFLTSFPGQLLFDHKESKINYNKMKTLFLTFKSLIYQKDTYVAIHNELFLA